ncbi:MAG: ABC transporter ATP-binding protein, partial [Acidobacteriota bacterium]
TIGNKMKAIDVKNITKQYGDFFAVKDLSFDVPSGSVYGLLGPNGAGKTTTIRMIMNVIIPDKGSIRVLGEKMSEKMKRRIGYLPEERGLYPKMKVGELLVFLAQLKDFRGNQAKDAIDKWLKRFDLLEWRDKKAEELSRGMQQKVQFIATVLHKPELIILDEPFSGLDPVNTKLLKDIMLEMRDEGVTIIFSTHRMEQVEMICDNICLINKAQSVLKGNLDEIKKEYGKNMVILEYDGNARKIRDYPDIEKLDDYGKYMEIKLKDGADPQKLLSSLAGKVKIDRFEIKEPTLNAIFIDKVGEKNE